MDKKYIISKMKRFCGFIAGIVFYISGLNITRARVSRVKNA